MILLRPRWVLPPLYQKFSKISKPLCNFIAKDVPFEFNLSYLAAFERLKIELTSAPIIRPPNWNLPFEVMYDASDYAIGVVLGQRVDRLPYVIFYASKTLNNTQLNYSTTEKSCWQSCSYLTNSSLPYRF